MVAERFTFMNDACGSLLSDEVKALRTAPPSEETWLAAAGLGSFMDTYFKMDKPSVSLEVLMEDMRDGLPQLNLEPEVANAVIEAAKSSFGEEVGVSA